MSPAGMPCAFTVTEPSLDLDPPTLISAPIVDTAGGAGRGQPGSTGTTNTWPSPIWRSLVLIPANPDSR
jgi:hypothetical protein